MAREESSDRFRVERLGVVMQADSSIPEEVEGVLNPAAARDPDGCLYLLPRVVGRGNYSRVGRARVRFGGRGAPIGVDRLGYALEPEATYELRPKEGTGGCEDPRVTFVEPLGSYIMAYTAWGATGPHVALAASDDLRSWRRLGLVTFVPDPDPVYGVDFDAYHNKDAVLFPRAVMAPNGEPSLALLHRPVYDVSVPEGITDPRPSIWISYCPLDAAGRDLAALTEVRQHWLVAEPAYPWEELRIGGGPPPLWTSFGWLLLHHGVSALDAPGGGKPPLRYCAGALVLDHDDPRRVIWRSEAPLLAPQAPEEVTGIVPNVVFPTGLDDRGDGQVDVYYGMADFRIGVARLTVPARLPSNGRTGEGASRSPSAAHP